MTEPIRSCQTDQYLSPERLFGSERESRRFPGNLSKYISLRQRMKARHTREVRIGNVTIGGDNPIAVQSMTATKTQDVAATIRQVELLEAAGADVIGRASCGKECRSRWSPYH